MGGCGCGQCDLGGCDYGQCDLGGCDYGQCDLGRYDCGQCDLGCGCSGCDLGGCTLIDAINYSMYITGISLTSHGVTVLNHAMRKCVFGSLRPGKTQTDLLSYRDQLES